MPHWKTHSTRHVYFICVETAGLSWLSYFLIMDANQTILIVMANHPFFMQPEKDLLISLKFLSNLDVMLIIKTMKDKHHFFIQSEIRILTVLSI